MLNIEEKCKKLEEIDLKISPEFFSYENINVPIIQELLILLNSIPRDGLQLIEDSCIPECVVEKIVCCMPTIREKNRVNNTINFIENEHMPAMRVVMFSIYLNFIIKKENKYYLTQEANNFVKLTIQEKFITVFYTMIFKLNLGFLDKWQKSELIEQSILIILHSIRDEDTAFRTSKKYTSLLVRKFPQLNELIQEGIVLEGYKINRKIDTFSKIIDTRIFHYFLLGMGLVKEQFTRGNDFKYIKSPLLEVFLEKK